MDAPTQGTLQANGDRVKREKQAGQHEEKQGEDSHAPTIGARRPPT